jgi:hypothetical protein
MDLIVKDQAVEDLESLGPDAREEVSWQRWRSLRRNSFHTAVSSRYRTRTGDGIWRLKVKRDHTDHRVFIDHTDPDFQDLSVAHRDEAYR